MTDLYRYREWVANLKPHLKNSSGFTLIEIILAISILSTLTVLSTQAISRSLKAKAKIQSEVDDSSALRDTMRLIKSDLNLAYHHRDVEKEIYDLLTKGSRPAPATPGTLNNINYGQGPQLPPRENKRQDPTTAFMGLEDQMSFVTKNNGRTMANAKQADFIEVGYSLKECRNLSDPSKSSKCLHRRTQTLIDEKVDEGGTEVVLLENVTEFKLRFIGEGKQEWVSTWRTDNAQDSATKGRYPEVVEVSLAIEREIEKKKRNYSAQFVIPIHFPNNPPKPGGTTPVPGLTQ